MSDRGDTPVASLAAAADPWTRRQRGWSRGFVAAVAGSVILHAAVFGLVLDRLMTPPTGGGGTLLDAIEIEVVDAQALESTTPTAAPAGGAVATSDASGATQAVTPIPASTAAAEPTPALATATDVPTQQRDADLVAGNDRRILPIETPAAALTDAPRIVESPKPLALATAAAAPSEPGGSTTSAPVTSAPSPAAAAASPGDIARFNAAVRKALAANRPKPGWPAGRVLLAFSVSDVGHVENAELVEASPNARLNRLTLAWISTIAMPEPPRGLALADRRYSVPVTVK